MTWLNLIGIGTAYAATPAGGAATHSPFGGGLYLIVMFGVLILLMFVMMRPQMKRAKEHRLLIQNLSAGDEIVTSGGIVGKIAKLHEKFITLSIDKNISLRLERNSISKVLPRGTIDSMD